MKLNFEEEAYNYILSKDKSIYIYIDSVKSRCVYIYNDSSEGSCSSKQSVPTPPQVKIGKPKDEDSDFRKKKYKDINVYISAQITEQQLEDKSIVLKKKLGLFNKIVIE